MFSLRGDSLDQLQSVESATMPLRFGLIGAEKLKIIGYNKMFLNGPNPPNPSLDTHRFVVERQNLCAFLQDCVRSCAQSSFFNADLLRYELPPELAPSPLPLLFSARLIRCENSTVDPNAIFELRVDYQWSEIGEKMPQNVAFNTKIATQSGHGVDVSLLSAEPPAKWVGEQCALSWEFRELLTTNGTLKATFKCSDGLLLANTYAQFQFSDTSLSGAQIHLDDHSGFVLSVFRKKLLSGKYFCEPSADR
ncbi:hypothetical protein niasHT_015693 [Heterodera trifolii]|uniref:Muniscin C-terminal domain-containing protein n=1 Tax=Heterodera trifolii TaxID=157864 RepID=A0ABD2L4D6_9BILA